MENITFSEYEDGMPACIRQTKPGCPAVAVIPSITVENKTGLKGVADCFVHVSSVNTTYYIDDKRRPIVVWSGPVEVNNYAYTTNPLGLRSQWCMDFQNNRAIYYNKSGTYKTITLGA